MTNEEFVNEEQDTGEEQQFDDFMNGGTFIKNPAVGNSIEFVLDKVVKRKGETIVNPKNGKKFSTALSGVDYYFDFVTTDGKAYSPKAWQVIGKIKAIGRKLGTLKGVAFKVTHISDGLVNKDVEAYKVYALVDGTYKELTMNNVWVAQVE